MSQHDPRPGAQRRRALAGPVLGPKQRAYRQRMRSTGSCPHCGQPCAPYYECAERRFYKGVYLALRNSAKRGIFYRDADGRWGLTAWLPSSKARA
jgi:hypothetical protein